MNSFVCKIHPDGAYAVGDAHGYFVKTALGTTYPLPIADYLFGLSVIDNSKPPNPLGPETTPKTESVQFGNQLVNAGSFVVQVGL